MIVFGDPQFSENFSVALARLRRRASVRGDSLDELRELLIECGQFEQAVADSDNEEFFACHRDEVQELTNLAARAFCAVYAKENSELPRSCSDIKISLNSLREKLEQDFPRDVLLTLKTPEGYEFYALYPEQYYVSAVRWAAEHRQTKHILVVGVRSIGTSLSAVVAAVLDAAGFATTRLTVRPKGHPFQRTANLPARLPTKSEHALIVDEGPGISGSSMVAVAQALVRSGILRQNIWFLPGSKNPPGSAASNEIRQWWNSTPCYFTPLDRVRWRQKSLQQLLLEKSTEICDGSEVFESISDCSNGLWRKQVYTNECDWPAVAIPFERTKFLVRASSGFSILWKFDGLSGIKLEQGESSRKDEIQLPERLAKFRGFTAFRWIEGTRLQRLDATAPLLRAVARYLNDAAGDSLSFDEIDSGIVRLSEMLRYRCQRTFQESMTCDTETLAESAREFFRLNPSDTSSRSYGDGRVAPHEWVRTSSGNIFKTDSYGHDTDHTIIGKQPMLWDIGGVLVEWCASGFCNRMARGAVSRSTDEIERRSAHQHAAAHRTALRGGVQNLPLQSAELFLKAIEENGTQVNYEALKFFELSYAAFRMGQCSLCAEINLQNPAERERLLQAAEYYRIHLARLLALPKHHSCKQPVLQNH